MKAIVTVASGGYDKLVYRDVDMPVPVAGEVLVKVLAAGINNTEINTRLGWYSSSVEGSTAATADGDEPGSSDGGWNEKTPFPLIQGTDCCGLVMDAASAEDKQLVGRRVLIRPCIRVHDFTCMDNIWMGSDFDGAFAQYVKIPASEVFPLNSDWTDAELGTIPCAYGTAENLLQRADLKAGESILISGASGGVGSAAVQLAVRRGARVIALADESKHEAMAQLGAERLLGRNTNLVDVLGEQSVDVVIDNVAGDGFPTMLKLLKRGGRLASSGAIAGPIVALDMRDVYLKDIALLGATAWQESVFPDLIGYIERAEIRPILAKAFPLASIADAQREFLMKRHVGNFVLLPWVSRDSSEA